MPVVEFFVSISVSVALVPLHSPASPLCCLSIYPLPLLSPEGPAVNFDLYKELVKCLCNPCVCVCQCVFIHPTFFFFFFLVTAASVCACRVILGPVARETSCLGPSDQHDWSHNPKALTHLPKSLPSRPRPSLPSAWSIPSTNLNRSAGLTFSLPVPNTASLA